MPITSPETPAWSGADLASNPHAVDDKARRVEQMFAAIAGSYDLNNRVHSFGRDQSWRRATVKMAEPKPTDVVLDVACGTGDPALAFRGAGVCRVIGIDFTVPMLDIAQRKTTDRDVTYHAGDAMRLPIADASVDIVSIAFGIRNVTEPAAALDEFSRVLRPGGRLVILEFSLPTNPVIRFFNRLYCSHIMPITATLLARDRSGAYRYLPKSVSTFIDREAMLALMTRAGLTEPTLKPLTFGTAVCYRAIKPT